MPPVLAPCATPGDRPGKDYETEKTASSPTTSLRPGDWSGCSELKTGLLEKKGPSSDPQEPPIP